MINGINVSELITRLQRFSNSIGNRVENEDWYDFINTCLRELKRGRTLPWQRRDSQIQFFNDVFKYQIPTDFASLISVGSQSLFNEDDRLIYTTEKLFRDNSNYNLALTTEKEKTFLLARLSGISDVKIDNFSDDATDYTLSGDASLPVRDKTDFKSDASLKFTATDLTHQSVISRTLANSVDITDYIGLGVLFIALEAPVALPGVSIRIGTDSSNYFTLSATGQYSGASFSAGWNEIGLEMANAVETGTVDVTDIKYYEVIVNNTSASGTYRLNQMFLRLGKVYEIVYNSKDVIKESSAVGNYQNLITTGDNEIVFDDDFEDLVLYKTLDLAGFFKEKDLDIVQRCGLDYQKAMIDFNNRYPSCEKRHGTIYYRNANNF